jgi:hypothetical protein
MKSTPELAVIIGYITYDRTVAPDHATSFETFFNAIIERLAADLHMSVAQILEYITMSSSLEVRDEYATALISCVVHVTPQYLRN